MNKTHLIGCFLLLVLSSSAQAALIEQDYATGTTTATGLGQSFTWTSSSPLVSIAISPAEASTWDLEIYNGGAICDGTAGIYTQSAITAIDSAITPGYQTPYFQTITLTTPLALTSGSTYTFCFYKNGGGSIVMAYDGGTDRYTGGSAYNDSGAVTYDLAFQLDVGASSTTSATAAPIGPVGVLALLAGILGFGGWSLRKKA